MFFANSQYLMLKSNEYDSFKTESGPIAFFVDKKLVFSRIVISYLPWDIKVEEIESFVEFVKKHYPNAIMLAKPHANLFIKQDPSILKNHNIKVSPWGTYVKNVDLPDKELLFSFKGNTRRDIQKAIEHDLKVQDVTPEICHKLLKDMFERHGQPAFTPSLNLVKGLSEKMSQNILMLGVYDGGNIQCIAVVPFDENRGYYLYGASIKRPQRGAMHLLQYELMKKLRDLGASSYDFYGARIGVDKKSKVAGIQRFKESFKPELLEGYSFKIILRPIFYRLFEYVVSAYYLFKGAKYEGDPIDQYLKEK